MNNPQKKRHLIFNDEQPDEPEDPLNNRINEATHNILDEQPEDTINNIIHIIKWEKD